MLAGPADRVQMAFARQVNASPGVAGVADQLPRWPSVRSRRPGCGPTGARRARRLGLRPTPGSGPERSILLNTNTRGSLAGRRGQIASTAAPGVVRLSTSTSTASAFSTACQVRSRRCVPPTVGVAQPGRVDDVHRYALDHDFFAHGVAGAGLAMSVTMAISSPAKAFIRLELPTLGSPTSTTVIPSRRMAPWRPWPAPGAAPAGRAVDPPAHAEAVSPKGDGFDASDA